MILIIAPNFGLARHYAAKHQIPTREWRYAIDSASVQIFGSGQQKAQVVVLTGDSQGDFSYSDSMMRAWKFAFRLEGLNRITLLRCEMEKPPNFGK